MVTLQDFYEYIKKTGSKLSTVHKGNTHVRQLLSVCHSIFTHSGGRQSERLQQSGHELNCYVTWEYSPLLSLVIVHTISQLSVHSANNTEGAWRRFNIYE